jgi:hypothetical protein
LRRFHQFQNKKEPVSETGAKERKKIQPQEEAGLRRRIFGESVEENPTEEDPVLNRPVCIHSISPVAHHRFLLVAPPQIGADAPIQPKQ